jgi:hypothetical protein
MSEYERSHPRWEIPPAGGTLDPGSGPPVAPGAAWLPDATPPPAAAEGAPIDRPRGHRRRPTPEPVPGRRRGLVAAAVGLSLLLGGGAGGIALAAGTNGADRGGVTTTADDAKGPGRGAPDGFAAGQGR